MLFIVVALYIEAKPIIAYYNLKKDVDNHHFQVFTNEEIALIVTGVGKVNSAVGVSHVLSKYMTGKNDHDHIINLGVCGSANKQCEVGEIYIIHKVIDHENKRMYFPDILLNHSFKEADIETFSSVVKHNQEVVTQLCDMEASGFYQAASKYLSPHQIHIIKVVSDYLEEETIEKNQITHLLHKNIERVNEYTHIIYKAYPTAEELADEQTQIITHIAKALRLSQTQKYQLLKAYNQYILRVGKVPTFLQTYQKIRVNSKHEGKNYFKTIYKRLLSE